MIRTTIAAARVAGLPTADNLTAQVTAFASVVVLCIVGLAVIWFGLSNKWGRLIGVVLVCAIGFALLGPTASRQFLTEIAQGLGIGKPS
jgi:hypothetical protein